MALNGFDLPVSPDQAVCIARGQFEAGDVTRAAEVCRRVLKERPGFAPALRLMGEVDFHRGNALYSRGDFDGAVATYGRAVELSPGFSDVQCNLGNALVAVGKITDAIGAYERAIELNPDCSQAHWNLALALLARGDFERGWAEYEWRHCEPSTPKCPGVAWKGEELEGRTILLIAEQGLGDAIQFVRYVPMVAARGGKIILVCQPELCRLFSAIEEVSAVVPFREALPKFDLYCHLMSLPGIFGTRVESIPRQIPYFHPDPALMEKWREILGPKDGKIRVGLAWAGRAEHQFNRHRSIALPELIPLGQVPGIEYHSLQIGPAAEERLDLPNGMMMRSHADRLTDLSQTAGLIANMDLVISVDTLIPHLAGALGTRVWLMLAHAADWRWLLARDDSPWYPTMRLFRQSSAGDWPGVVNSILRALSAPISV